MNKTILIIGLTAGLFGLAFFATSWAGRPEVSETNKNPPAGGASDDKSTTDNKLELATFGTGCFWCTEAVFDQLKGVESVESGYSGGELEDPTYEQVSGGQSGHAEVVQITFDSAAVSFAELLEAFWQTHDPTTLNRQGNDVGTQYRSAIFYHDDEQRKQAEHYKQKLNESGAFRSPIVTEITPFTKFYPAEKYHQDYFNLNPTQPYCAAIIRPKVDKFKKAFKDKLKAATESAGSNR
jgi:peptide-methionine (S)-S-oxide reductase